MLSKVFAEMKGVGMNTNKQIIDLHMHSINSDGTCTTQQILDMLRHRNATIISFTDHDSVGCYYDLKAGKASLYSGVKLIPGVELSCTVDGRLRDILGYGISVPYISDFLNSKYSIESRIKKQQHILSQLMSICKKMGLQFDDTITVQEGKKAEGFVVMYNELNRHPQNVERYPFIVNNTKFYWDYFSNKDSAFFVDETFDLPSFADAIDIIHCAGGKAFLAHPFAYGMNQSSVELLVEEAVKAGVDGIELKHSSNKNSDVEQIFMFAQKYNLLLSGGSDFHGSTKPGLELVHGYGNMCVQFEEIAPWINDVIQVDGDIDEDILKLWSR